MAAFNSLALFVIGIAFVSCLQLCPNNKFWSPKQRICKNCSQCTLLECQKCSVRISQHRIGFKHLAIKRRELADDDCESSNQRCIICLPNSHCGLCVNGFAPNPSGTCAACSSTCLTCTAPASPAACATCRVNYYLNDAFNCVICSSAFGADCKECTKFGCDICYTGTPIAGNPGCDTSTPPPPPTTCSANCLNCSSPTVCLNCDQNYQLQADACVSVAPSPSPTPSCSSNCLNCSSPTVCLSCDSNYQLQADACVSVAPPPNGQSQPVLGSVSPLGKTIKAMCVALTVLSWGIFFIAIPSIKLAGLEQLFVMQFAWINLVFLPSPYPPTYASASPLKYCSGYAVANGDLSFEVNRNYQPEHFTIDTRHFTNNFNLVLILYLLPLLLVVIFKILSKTENYKDKAVERMEFWIEMTMYGVMANLVGLTIYAGIFFTGGESSHPASILLIFLSLAITIGILIVFFFYPDPFQRFRYSFKTSALSFGHYYIHTANLILIVALVAGAPSAPWAPCIPLVILAIYTLLFRPYKVLIENFRSFFFLLVMIATAIIRTVICSSSNEWRMSQTPVIMLVILVFVLLLLCTIWAYFEVLRYILCERRVENEKKKQLDYALFEDSQMMREICNKQNMSKIMSLTPMSEFNTSQSLRKDFVQGVNGALCKGGRNQIKSQKLTQKKAKEQQSKGKDPFDSSEGRPADGAQNNCPVIPTKVDLQQCGIGQTVDQHKKQPNELANFDTDGQLCQIQDKRDEISKVKSQVMTENQARLTLNIESINQKKENGDVSNMRKQVTAKYEEPLSPKRSQLYKILKSQLNFLKLKNAQELSKPNDQSLLNAYQNI